MSVQSLEGKKKLTALQERIKTVQKYLFDKNTNKNILKNVLRKVDMQKNLQI